MITTVDVAQGNMLICYSDEIHIDYMLKTRDKSLEFVNGVKISTFDEEIYY
jgi:hypothetical protein